MTCDEVLGAPVGRLSGIPTSDSGLPPTLDSGLPLRSGLYGSLGDWHLRTIS